MAMATKTCFKFMDRLRLAVEEVEHWAGPPLEKLSMDRLRTAVEEVEN